MVDGVVGISKSVCTVNVVCRGCLWVCRCVCV
jgi:hypothetical protein